MHTSNPIKEINFFDIPHILDSICYHLQSKDIQSCCQVNTAWSTVFMHLHWESVYLRDHMEKPPCVDDHQLALIQQNARFIRRLAIQSDHLGRYLSDIQCTLLQELELELHSTEREEEWDGLWMGVEWDNIKTESTLNAIANVLDTNPGLRTLILNVERVDSLSDRFVSQDSPTFVALSTHPQLVDLNIAMLDPTAVSCVNLFRCLPRTLQTLQVSINQVPTAEDGSSLLQLMLSPQGRIVDEFPLYEALQEVDIDGAGVLVSDPGLVTMFRSFLGRCPRLKKLSLPFGSIYPDHFQLLLDALKQSGAHLKHLAMTGLNSGNLLKTILFLQGFPGLVDIFLSGDWEAIDGFIKIVDCLIQSLGTTLEKLAVVTTGAITDQEIVKILTSFSNLKHLYIRNDTFGKTRAGIQLEDLFLDSGSASPTPVEWACQGLEFLRLSIMSPSLVIQDGGGNRISAYSSAGPLDENLEQQAATRLGILCKQLRTLSKLKRLHLWWDFVDINSPNGNIYAHRGPLRLVPKQQKWCVEGMKAQGLTAEDMWWMSIDSAGFD